MWLKSVACSRVLRVFLFERWPTEVSGCNNSSGRSCGRSGHLRQRQLTQKTKIPLVQNISQNWTMPIIYTPTNSGGVEIIFSLVWPSLLPPVRRFSTLQPSELLETKSVVIPCSNPHKTFPHQLNALSVPYALDLSPVRWYAVALCLIRCAPTQWDTVISPWMCQAVTAWRSVYLISFVTIATFRSFRSRLQGLVLHRPPLSTVAKIPLPQALVTLYLVFHFNLFRILL